MKDTLKIIQKGSEIARIVSKVLMVIGIVAASLCLVGILCTALDLDQSFQIGGVTIRGIVSEEAKVNLSNAEMYSSMITGFVMCLLLALNAGFTTNFFKKELEIGTPFDFTVVKEMFRLGILLMALTLGATVIVGTVEGIMTKFFDSAYKSEVDAGGSFFAGLMFFLMSFICKHGAEVSGKTEPAVAEK